MNKRRNGLVWRNNFRLRTDNWANLVYRDSSLPQGLLFFPEGEELQGNFLS